MARNIAAVIQTVRHRRLKLCMFVDITRKKSRIQLSKIFVWWKKCLVNMNKRYGWCMKVAVVSTMLFHQTLHKKWSFPLRISSFIIYELWTYFTPCSSFLLLILLGFFFLSFKLSIVKKIRNNKTKLMKMEGIIINHNDIKVTKCMFTLIFLIRNQFISNVFTNIIFATIHMIFYYH